MAFIMKVFEEPRRRAKSVAEFKPFKSFKPFKTCLGRSTCIQSDLKRS